MIVTDDIDGSKDAETITFGLDGTTYEIDLSATNRARLADAYAPFIASARRESSSPAAHAATRTAGMRAERAAVRAWAKEEGLDVSDRGRLSASIIRQYEARQQNA